MQQKRPLLKPILLLVAFIVVVVIISALAMSGIFHKNPYGPSIRIDNFKQYINNISTDDYDNATALLYSNVADSLDDNTEVPKSGALIRNGSVKNIEPTTEAPLTSSISFLVDIASVERTYRIQFNYSNDQDAVITYPVIIFCPTKSEQIYPSFPCTDMNYQGPISEIYDKHTFLDDLPLTISEYNETNTTYRNYRINYEIADTNNPDSSVKIIITDYTGGNYENAIEKLRNIGADLSVITVEYNNVSNDYQTKPAGPAPNTYEIPKP